MIFTIAYWHWLILGMALLIAEMFLGSMASSGSGLGPLIIAALVFFVPDMESDLATLHLGSSYPACSPSGGSNTSNRAWLTVPRQAFHGRLRWARPALSSGPLKKAGEAW